MEKYRVLYYEIWEGPKMPDEAGTYYCKTPILEQAENFVARAAIQGKGYFIKAVCSDGKKRCLL